MSVTGLPAPDGGAAEGDGSTPLPDGSAGLVSGHKSINTGRNLPVAIGVSLLLGAVVVVTLLTVKVLFLALVAVLVATASWELRTALRSRDVNLPVPVVVAGGAAMMALGYHWGATPALAAFSVTVIALLTWRLRGGAPGYVRDVTSGVFALAYTQAPAAFVALMLARPDGAHRALLFVILTVCSDTGGYFAGILTGRHLLAPLISPKKSWEGFAGSAALCLAGGGIGMPLLLHGQVWQGLLLGAAAVILATLGDLAESMIKRDLDIKDMGSILPGHGGVLDRLDAMLMVAPAAWLLMAVFLPAAHTA
jgi:phosphatidate cytidylyltransferase